MQDTGPAATPSTVAGMRSPRHWSGLSIVVMTSLFFAALSRSTHLLPKPGCGDDRAESGAVARSVVGETVLVLLAALWDVTPTVGARQSFCPGGCATGGCPVAGAWPVPLVRSA